DRPDGEIGEFSCHCVTCVLSPWRRGTRTFLISCPSGTAVTCDRWQVTEGPFCCFRVPSREIAKTVEIASLNDGGRCGNCRFLSPRVRPLLVAIGHRDEPPAAVEAHDVGLVVVGPVADIFAALRRQEFEGVPGLLQARAQPADRPRTGGVRDRRQRARDDRLFLARRRFVEAARIAFAMTHPLPAALS